MTNREESIGRLVRDGTALTGLALLATGICQWSWPVACVTVGTILLGVSLAGALQPALPRRPQRPDSRP
ncbi:MAG TPA: hypothetical protein VGG64_29945 [Pirellulales bacterium]|jgi:hypothetical protein